MIQTKFDRDADVLHVTFGPEDANYDGSEQIAPGGFLEFDTAGQPMGIEVISVRLRVAGVYPGTEVAQPAT